MIIANPMFDSVFKNLMENEKIAKFFIGTLLNQTIEFIEFKPQEYTHIENRDILTVFKLDFIATIKTETGELKKILIEIQKTRNEVDIMRFRNYLAEHYKKEDIVNGKETVLPITTIYILGFNLPDIDTPCIKVERNYKDLINNVIIDKKSDFVEKLTHDSFVVQVKRITGKYQNRLDKLLSIFEQINFLDDKKITKNFKYPLDNDDNMKLIVDRLHYIGVDPDTRKELENEQEAWRMINVMIKNRQEELEEEKKELEENKRELEEKLEEKERLIEELKKKLEKK